MHVTDKRRVLLTGASGGLGREVLALLVEAGHHVRVFDVKSRKSEKLFRRFGSSIEVRYGDLSRRDDLEDLCTSMDCIIHLAAIIPPLANDNPELATAVNLKGTQYLLERIAHDAPDAFLLFASSLAVYGDRLSDPYIEVGDPLQESQGDHYGWTKIQAEEIVRTSGLKWCIFRFSAMLSYIDFQMSPTKFDIPLDTSMEFTSLEDAAAACARSLDHVEELKHQIYNVGGGVKFRMAYRQFLTRFYQIFGLGDLDYPDKTFAEQNFSCGYLKDGHILNDILKFQNTTSDSYFTRVSSGVPAIQKWITSMFSTLIKKQLLKKSKPYEAYRNNDTAAMNQYFKD